MAGTSQPEQGDHIPLSEQELELAFSGPAVVTNKIYATRTTAGIRLAFTEQRTQESLPVFRTAVMVPYADAIGLRDLLSRLLEGIEPQLQAAMLSNTAKDD